jgi:glycosyltransferase involved in cell wall biosynthesis
MNTVSFIIPAYNYAHTLKEAVASILDTNFNDGDEIIIVDDKSTDATCNVARALAAEYKGIQVFEHETNKGGGAARNTAVRAAKNNLIFCLDADNVLPPYSIAPLKKYLTEQSLDVAAFQELRYFKTDISHVTHVWRCKEGPVGLADVLAGNISPPASGNYIYTKQSWEKAGGYPENTILDTWGFGLRQVATGARMGTLPHSHYFHRYGHDSYYAQFERSAETHTGPTELLRPFFDLLDPHDVAYITSDAGARWFQNLGTRPLHLKNGALGETGYMIRLEMPPRPSILKRTVRKFRNLRRFKIQFDAFNAMAASTGTMFARWQDRYPIFGENTLATSFDAHYTYHPAWAARILAQVRPREHIDIGGILSFSAMLSAFIPVKFYDWRPAPLRLSNLYVGRADLTSLPFQAGSVESISCMHTIEHVGLGRYGDTLDPKGDKKAIEELIRVTRPGGTILFASPIGKEKIMFNAHRIYSYKQILSYFGDTCELKDFFLIPDNAQTAGPIENASEADADTQTYGCGCFWFVKK